MPKGYTAASNKSFFMTQYSWDTACYDKQHAFVWQYGKTVLELLAPQSGEHILDLGCGTGHLTQEIAIAGANAWGIDASPDMINQAQQNYPHLKFCVADARQFQVDHPLDAVFSNATLHWIKEPIAVIRCINQALKPGGRFVAEFGGKGNVRAIVAALYTTLEKLGFDHPESKNPWYFPSIAEYAQLLEQHGFDVTYATLFDRPTSLAGESGMANWLNVFANHFLSDLSADQRSTVIWAVEDYLRPTHYQNGVWVADYRRLRVVAVKQ